MADLVQPTTHPIIPKLELHKLRDDELDEYAQEKIDKINAINIPPSPPPPPPPDPAPAPAAADTAGSANPFARVNPSTEQVNAKNIEWRAALAKADDGSKADTALKDQRRKELEALLTLQATDCAKIANGDFPLYLRTGYEAKNTQGSPTGELPAVTGLLLFYGDNDGELKAEWNVMEDADNFLVRAFSDINNPDGSLLKEYIIGKIGKQKTTLTGLPSGQKIFVRVRANGGSTGQGAWSDVAEKRVP